MATSTSSVVTSTTIPVVAITHDTPRLQPLLFPQLDATERNYLLWAKTSKAYIFAKNLSESIAFDRDFVVSPTISPSISWKTLLLLRRHLDPSLEHQYLDLDKLDELWQKLKSRFDQ